MVLLRVGLDYKNERIGWGNLADGSWHPHMTYLELLQAAEPRFDVALEGVDLAKCRVCVLRTVRGGTSYVPGHAAPDAADLATAHELVGSMTIGSLPDVVMETGTVWVQVYLPPPGTCDGCRPARANMSRCRAHPHHNSTHTLAQTAAAIPAVPLRRPLQSRTCLLRRQHLGYSHPRVRCCIIRVPHGTWYHLPARNDTHCYHPTFRLQRRPRMEISRRRCKVVVRRTHLLQQRASQPRRAGVLLARCPRWRRRPAAGCQLFAACGDTGGVLPYHCGSIVAATLRPPGRPHWPI